MCDGRRRGESGKVVMAPFLGGIFLPFFFFFGYILFLPLVLLNESNDTVPRKRDPNTPGGG